MTKFPTPTTVDQFLFDQRICRVFHQLPFFLILRCLWLLPDLGLPDGQTVEWNAAGGGFGPDGSQGAHWQNFNDKPIYLLSDSDRDLIFEVLRGEWKQLRAAAILCFTMIFPCPSHAEVQLDQQV